MIRAHIRINTTQEAAEFVQRINVDDTMNTYTIMNATGTYRANARSIVGVIYAMTDFSDHMYLVNETEDGVFPRMVDQYRV